MDGKVSAGGAPTHPGHETVLSGPELGGLGPLVLEHPPGTFHLTPASRITLEGVARRRDALAGTGLDWGSGVGGLAILAARIPGVARVVGLDLCPGNVETARLNAARNGVEEKVRFVAADSFRPLDPGDAPLLNGLRGRVDFLLANPPAAETGDGFAFRRRILTGARAFLRPDAIALLQISAQYGGDRIRSLETDVPGFRWDGPVASTEPVPFDLDRPDLRDCLELYARTEEAGGREYAFEAPEGDGTMTASEALDRFRREGEHPLARWQVHEFRWEPDGSPRGA
ncbi:MAG TPA: methyltransferase [Longimicrobiales bacterium]|nr:methyltransferase [Longimicrobiales bacterium]